MTNEVKGGGSYELSTDINVITAEINAYQRVAGEAIFEIGKRLKHVKENDLAHGEFGGWVESVGMTHQHANKFMRVASELSDGNYASVSNLGIAALYEIATMPEESRTEPHTIPSTGATKTVDEMTVRELREVKAELKKTQAEREQAEQRAKLAESQADVAIRSEELMREHLDELEDGHTDVEIRTQYVEIPDAESRKKVERYEELFGDVSMYDGQTTRVTNGDAITYTVFEFTEATRGFVARFGHLTHFAAEFGAMIDEGKQEYRTAINDMRRFLTILERSMDETKTTIING